MSIESWIQREFDKEAKTPTLESALLGDKFRPYLSYRLRLFSLRTSLIALTHAIEFPFIYSSIHPHSISPILLFAAVMHLVGQWWWGALEALRSEVREAVEDGRGHRIAQVINPWLRFSLLVALAFFIIGLAATFFISYHARFPYGSPEQAVMLIYLVRTAFHMPVAAYHSGIYAVRRVHRPIFVTLAVDFFGIGTALATWSWLGSWAAPISLLCSSIAQSGVAIVFVRRMYDFAGWNVHFPPRAGRLVPAKTLIAWRLHLPAIAAVVMSLDSLMVIALSLPRQGSSDHTLATLLFLIAPLVRACHDWAIMFLPDIRRLDLELFEHLLDRLNRAVRRVSLVVAVLCWILATTIALSILGVRAFELLVALAPLFAVRSVLAFAQLRAFSTGYFTDIILGGACFILGAVAVPFIAATDIAQILCFAALYIPIIIVTGLRFLRLVRTHYASAIQLPSRWFHVLQTSRPPIFACAVELPFDIRASEHRHLVRFLARAVYPEGAVSSFRDTSILVFDTSERLREKVQNALEYSAGAFEKVHWFTNAAECREYARQRLAVPPHFAPDSEVIDPSREDFSTRLTQHFQTLFPDGMVISLDSNAHSLPVEDIRKQTAILSAALSFAKRWDYSPNRSSSYEISAFVNKNVISSIFVIPNKNAERRETIRQWGRYIALANLSAVEQKSEMSVSSIS